MLSRSHPRTSPTGWTVCRAASSCCWCPGYASCSGARWTTASRFSSRECCWLWASRWARQLSSVGGQSAGLGGHHDGVETGSVPGSHRVVIVFQKSDLEPRSLQQPLQVREADRGHGVAVVPAFAAAAGGAGDAEHQLEDVAAATVVPPRAKAQLAVSFRDACLYRPAGGDACGIHRVEDEHAARLEGAPRPAQGFLQGGGGVTVMDRIEKTADQIESFHPVEGGQVAQQQFCLGYPLRSLGEHVPAV